MKMHVFARMLCALYTVVFSQITLADQHDIYRAVAPSLVRISAETSNGSLFSGTAISLGNKKFVTNCHVTATSETLSLVLHDGTVYTPVTQAAIAENDLCLLTFRNTDIPAINRRNSPLKLNEAVYALGYNGGARSLTFQKGEILALFPHNNGMVIQTSAAFAEGASGGALTDKEGNLIGILTFYGNTKKGRVYFALGLSWLPELLKTDATHPSPFTQKPFWMKKLEDLPYFLQEIGRASCRERVCLAV